MCSLKNLLFRKYCLCWCDTLVTQGLSLGFLSFAKGGDIPATLIGIKMYKVFYIRIRKSEQLIKQLLLHKVFVYIA